jgi:NAD+ kinase
MKIKIVRKPSAQIVDIENKIRDLAKTFGYEITEEDPDIVFAVGGDGTLLRAIKYDKPIIAVKAGRRGFLMDVNPEKLEEVFKRLSNNDYTKEEYLLLETNVNGISAIAFNEIGILYDKPEALKINIKFLNENIVFEGDGVLVSSPQGTSAWSFSISGNYIYNLNALEICLVNPILTSLKSIIIPPLNVKLKLENKGYPQLARLVADGEIIAKIEVGNEINIWKSNKKANIYRFYEIDPIKGILNGKRDI